MSVRFGVLASPEIASAAICDGARSQARYSIAAILPLNASFQSYCRLLESATIDAVYLGEGTERSFERALASVASGIHVLYEQMPTATPDDWHALACVARASKVPVLIGDRSLLAPANRAASSLARSGKLGDLTSYSAVVCTPGGDLPARVLACVNHARELFDSEPLEVLAATRCEHPRVLSIALRFATGQLAFASCGFDRPSHVRYDIMGADGDVRVAWSPSSSSPDEILATISGVSSAHDLDRSSGLGFSMSQFACEVSRARIVDSTQRFARSNARILEAIKQACRAEQSVRVEGLLDPEVAPRLNFPDSTDPAMQPTK